VENPAGADACEFERTNGNESKFSKQTDIGLLFKITFQYSKRQVYSIR
jgi:hypothetical protein